MDLAPRVVQLSITSIYKNKLLTWRQTRRASNNSVIEPEPLEGVPGRYWHPLEDGRMQCDICPHYCRLNEGQRGLCFGHTRQLGPGGASQFGSDDDAAMLRIAAVS